MKKKKLHLMISIIISGQVLSAPTILGWEFDFPELLVWLLGAGSALIAAGWGLLRWARVKFPDIYDEQSATALRER